MTMNSTNYKQYDTRWATLPYPKKPWYIKNCGCGEVSICNAIIEMAEYSSQTPKTIQPYCKQYAAPNGDGTYHSGIPAMMKHYGMTEVMEHATMKPLWDELAKGDRVAIYLMGKREAGSKKIRWTSSGHFVCSVGYKYENGKHYVYVKDSNSTSASRNGWISYEENMKNAVLKVWSGKIKVISPTEYRPTTPYEGSLPKATVKEGSKGDDAKACQTFLNWCINYGLSVDGNIGAKSVNAIKIYQKTYGLGTDGVFGSKSRAKAEEIIKEHANTPKAYDGEYPDTTVDYGSKIIAKAKALAGSSSEPTTAYKNALNKAYPNRKSWGEGSRLGRACDVFVGTVVRSLGFDKDCPRGLEQQLTYKPNSKYFTRHVYNNVKPYDVSQTGDIIFYDKPNGHTCIRTATGIYEANHSSNKYPHFTMGFGRLNTKRNKVVIWRATRNYLEQGDSGEQVKRLQRYINWFFHDKYGKDVLVEDGKFGPATQNYTKLMQSELGFTDCDGLVGEKTIAAMKNYKK